MTTTCMLPAGHSGPHEWTRDDELWERATAVFTHTLTPEEVGHHASACAALSMALYPDAYAESQINMKHETYLDLDSIIHRCKTDAGAAKFVSQICDITDLEAVIRLCAQEEDDEELGRLIRRTIFLVKVRRLAEEVFSTFDAERGTLTDVYSAGGMSLLDYFAAAALTGLVSHESAWHAGEEVKKWTAKMAYSYADAMIKARVCGGGT